MAVLRITIQASQAGSATTSGSGVFASGHPEWIVVVGATTLPSRTTTSSRSGSAQAKGGARTTA